MEKQGSEGCLAKLSKLRGIVTVELILVLYAFGGALLSPSVSSLFYRKVCLEKLNLTVCDNLEEERNRDFENEVQSDVSRWYLASSLCGEIPQILLSPFYGSLSDHVGRKVALALPLIGQIASSGIYVINSIFLNLPVWHLLFASVVSGIFGGWLSSGMACFAYLSEITTEKNRTGRIAIAEGAISVTTAVAFLIGGRILDSTSYVFVNSLAFGLYAAALMYTVFWIQELPSSRLTERDCKTACSKLFSSRSVKALFAVIFKQRERNRRAHILVCLSILSFGSVAISAEFSVQYLYLRKQPLEWSQSLYGYFTSYYFFMATTSQLLVLPFLTKRLHLADTSIIILSLISMASSMMLFAFSTRTWMVFLVPLVGMLGPLSWVLLRSMLSKMVEKEELGRVFAVFGIIQTLDELISSLIYDNLYPATLYSWNGLCFLLGAALCVVPLGLTIWLTQSLKKYGCDSYTTPLEEEDSMEERKEANVAEKRTKSTDMELGASLAEEACNKLVSERKQGEGLGGGGGLGGGLGGGGGRRSIS